MSTPPRPSRTPQRRSSCPGTPVPCTPIPTQTQMQARDGAVTTAANPHTRSRYSCKGGAVLKGSRRLTPEERPVMTFSREFFGERTRTCPPMATFCPAGMSPVWAIVSFTRCSNRTCTEGTSVCSVVQGQTTRHPSDPSHPTVTSPKLPNRLLSKRDHEAHDDTQMHHLLGPQALLRVFTSHSDASGQPPLHTD